MAQSSCIFIFMKVPARASANARWTKPSKNLKITRRSCSWPKQEESRHTSSTHSPPRHTPDTLPRHTWAHPRQSHYTPLGRALRHTHSPVWAHSQQALSSPSTLPPGRAGTLLPPTQSRHFSPSALPGTLPPNPQLSRHTGTLPRHTPPAHSPDTLLRHSPPSSRGSGLRGSAGWRLQWQGTLGRLDRASKPSENSRA